MASDMKILFVFNFETGDYSCPWWQEIAVVYGSNEDIKTILLKEIMALLRPKQVLPDVQKMTLFRKETYLLNQLLRHKAFIIS